jgi:hypothetical protein
VNEAVETAPTPAPESAAPAATLTPPDAAGTQRLDKSKDARRQAALAAVRRSAAAPERAAPATAAPAQSEPGATAESAPTHAPAVEPQKAAPQADAAPAKDPRAELERAKQLQAIQKREREAYEAKQAAKAAEERLAALEKQLEAERGWKSKNPLELLQERGTTYEQLTKEIVEGKYKPKSPEQLAIEGTKSEMEELRAQIKAEKEAREALERQRTEEAEQTKFRQVREQETAYVADQLKAAAAKYPMLSSMKWGPSKVVERFYEKAQANDGLPPALDEVLGELEQAIAADADPLFSNDAILEARLKARIESSPEFKTRMSELLGIKQSQPAQQATRATSGGNGPTAIPQAKAADPGTRKTASRSVTPAQRRAAAVASVIAKRKA